MVSYIRLLDLSYIKFGRNTTTLPLWAYKRYRWLLCVLHSVCRLCFTIASHAGCSTQDFVFALATGFRFTASHYYLPYDLQFPCDVASLTWSSFASPGCRSCPSLANGCSKWPTGCQNLYLWRASSYLHSIMWFRCISMVEKSFPQKSLAPRTTTDPTRRTHVVNTSCEHCLHFPKVKQSSVLDITR